LEFSLPLNPYAINSWQAEARLDPLLKVLGRNEPLPANLGVRKCAPVFRVRHPALHEFNAGSKELRNLVRFNHSVEGESIVSIL
jgi:hypothetical protein